jgi:hypothetical protein
MPLSFSERACPTTGQLVSGNFEYFPEKLGFGNDTYSRLKGYRIETMGPASVHPSVLTQQPVSKFHHHHHHPLLNRVNDRYILAYLSDPK